MTRRGEQIGLLSLGSALGALFVAILVLVASPSAPPPAQASSSLSRPREKPQASDDGLPRIGPPIANLRLSDIHDTFNEGRSGGRAHEATDIMEPRGTPVLAVVSGTIVKLFTSRPGGLTVYQFDSGQVYCYYYAHLDRYAEGISSGMTVPRGAVVGYVGSTGNADPSAPHLHFGISRIGPGKHWWGGQPVDPYPALIQSVKK